MKSCFLNRGYPKTLIDTEISKVKLRNTSGDKRTKTNGISLVITYHPLLKDFAKVINRQLHLLYLNDEVLKKNIYSWSHGFIWGSAEVK